MNIELDHLFVFVERGGAATAAKLEAEGLVPTYRREHMGQGTANLCYAFDNAYLELLWVEEPDVLAGATFARTRLWERSRWRSDGTSPFGVCVRADEPLPFPCWLWRPPYLPPNFYLEVAKDVADPRLPFLFRFPGAERPDRWHEGRAGRRQRDAGLAEIESLALAALPSAQNLPELALDPALGPQRCILTLSRSDGGEPRRLALPEAAWLA